MLKLLAVIGLLVSVAYYGWVKRCIGRGDALGECYLACYGDDQETAICALEANRNKFYKIPGISIFKLMECEITYGRVEKIIIKHFAKKGQ